MRKIIFIITVALFAISCGGSGNENNYKPEITGSPYEMVVVCDNDLWETSVGDTVKNFFQEPVLMLNAAESRFSLIRKRISGFKGIFKNHRNVLILEIKNDLPDNKATLKIGYDVWASPQIVVSIQAPDEKSMYDLFVAEDNNILQKLEDFEQQRFDKKLTDFASVKLDTTLRNSVNVGISLPKNYEIRNIEAPDFAWLSYEMPLSSQGVVVYNYPLSDLSNDLNGLISQRNKFVGRIPGALEGTYMKTSDAFAPLIDTLNINGKEWIKTSGFWNVEGDFMGGPYRNFITVDSVNNRVVGVDLYVYSPDGGKGQRNYIKQLEAVINTIKL